MLIFCYISFYISLICINHTCNSVSFSKFAFFQPLEFVLYQDWVWYLTVSYDFLTIRAYKLIRYSMQYIFVFHERSIPHEDIPSVATLCILFPFFFFGIFLGVSCTSSSACASHHHRFAFLTAFSSRFSYLTFWNWCHLNFLGTKMYVYSIYILPSKLTQIKDTKI